MTTTAAPPVIASNSAQLPGRTAFLCLANQGQLGAGGTGVVENTPLDGGSLGLRP